MISAKTHALRFRIWQFAAPREWDVTIAEIADGIGESVQSVRQCISHNPSWHGRVRWTTEGVSAIGAHNAGNYTAARHIAQDILAGRVNMEI